MRATRQGDLAVVTIEDSGPGVPPAEREKVFQRFYRVPQRNNGPGTGLGLAIVKVIADLLKIEVDLDESAALGGLRATLRAPIAAPENEGDRQV